MFQLKTNINQGYFCFTKWKMTIFLSKSVKLTLEVFLGYSYDLAYSHPDILIEAILIKKSVYCFFFFYTCTLGLVPGVGTDLDDRRGCCWRPCQVRYQFLTKKNPVKVLLKWEKFPNFFTKKCSNNKSLTLSEEKNYKFPTVRTISWKFVILEPRQIFPWLKKGTCPAAHPCTHSCLSVPARGSPPFDVAFYKFPSSFAKFTSMLVGL